MFVLDFQFFCWFYYLEDSTTISRLNTTQIANIRTDLLILTVKQENLTCKTPLTDKKGRIENNVDDSTVPHT